MIPSPEEIRARYRDMISARGEPVVLKDGAQQATVYARVTGFQPDELVDGVQQGDRKLIMLAEDFEGATGARPIPAEKLRIVVQDEPLIIIKVDTSSRRVGGVLIAYELTARGHHSI